MPKTAPSKTHKNKKKLPALRIASWNVRTMTAGLSDDLQQIDVARKTAIIDAEFHRLDIDIAALQETRLADNWFLTEMHYTFFWQGKKLDDRSELGVGFAVRNSPLSIIEPPAGGSERILTLPLSTSSGPVNIATAYAPTWYSNPDVKDQFYNALDHTIWMLTPSEHIYLLGDFNARVGAEHNGKHAYAIVVFEK